MKWLKPRAYIDVKLVEVDFNKTKSVYNTKMEYVY